jgi:hypothetical protein
MTVQLTPEQRDVLLELVNREMLEIGPEIHHTWTRDYREGLKEQRQTLQSLRDMLAAAEQTPAESLPKGP